MPEWLIERGIGETRTILVEDGNIIEARIQLEGATPVGSVVTAQLTGVGTGGRNAVARDKAGIEYLLPRGATGVSEGAALTIEVTREAIPGSEPWKRPLAKVTDEQARAAPSLVGAELPLPRPGDELAAAGWSELIEEARSGIVGFPGGELRISPTAAMTLIDVDGYLPPEELAIAGAIHAARAIRRLDIGGSIGIDLPTTGSKAARQATATAFDAVLPRPFERTAVNGFGFVQIVRPRLRASMVELAQDCAAFEARALLRRAAFEPPGAKRIVGHPAVISRLAERTDWIDRIARQLGGGIELRTDAALPMSGGYAEAA